MVYISCWGDGKTFRTHEKKEEILYLVQSPLKLIGEKVDGWMMLDQRMDTGQRMDWEGGGSGWMNGWI